MAFGFVDGNKIVEFLDDEVVGNVFDVVFIGTVTKIVGVLVIAIVAEGVVSIVAFPEL